MTSFRHDIAGGQGDLIIDALHSPNFMEGVSGWSVNADGTAEFNNLEIRGTFSGINWILNSNGLFFYAVS